MGYPLQSSRPYHHQQNETVAIDGGLNMLRHLVEKDLERLELPKIAMADGISRRPGGVLGKVFN